MFIHRSTLFLSLLLAGTAGARDGDLDRSFGTGGKVITPYPGPVYTAYGYDLAMQSSGKLIVAGTSLGSGSNENFAALRLNADGSVDSTFGILGWTSVAFDRSGSNLSDLAQGVVVQPDDSILIAGDVAGDSTTGEDMGVVKLTADGQLDTSFGNSGKAIVPFNLDPTSNSDFVFGIEVQGDHAILLAGAAQAMGNTQMMAIARLTPGGFRDTSFDSDGRVTLGFGGDFAIANRARVLSDGTHILVVGGATTVAGGRRSFALVRLNIADGSLDSGFGTGGKATYDFAASAGDSSATDFAELADGRLMVCGGILANQPSNYDFACMRFLANGTPDMAFVPAVIPFDIGGDFNDFVYRVKRDTQGRFVLAGSARVATNNADCSLARITPNGQLDPSFGVGGRTTYDGRLTAIDTDRDNGCAGLVLQPDGRIVAMGYAVIDASFHRDFEVVRIVGDTIFADGFGP